jgi:hypothetical protein
MVHGGGLWRIQKRHLLHGFPGPRAGVKKKSGLFGSQVSTDSENASEIPTGAIRSGRPGFEFHMSHDVFGSIEVGRADIEWRIGLIPGDKEIDGRAAGCETVDGFSSEF